MDQAPSLLLDGVDVSAQGQYFQGADCLVLPLDGNAHQLCWQFQPVVASAAVGASVETIVNASVDTSVGTSIVSDIQK